MSVEIPGTPMPRLPAAECAALEAAQPLLCITKHDPRVCLCGVCMAIRATSHMSSLPAAFGGQRQLEDLARLGAAVLYAIGEHDTATAEQIVGVLRGLRAAIDRYVTMYVPTVGMEVMDMTYSPRLK
jgi:hypothetical protein